MNDTLDLGRIAIFVSTSGHSGVDRAMKHLIPELACRGYSVDLLKVRRHGPELSSIPDGVRVIDTGSRHTYGALGAVARYLKAHRPAVLLADKDRVNRTALLARALARVPTRLVLSSGTTISVDLQHRGRFERYLQRFSMGRLYRFADQVIVTCEDVADDMSEYTGLPRAHIQSVASPVIPDHWLSEAFPRPNHPWFQAGQPPVILGVGELGMRKDFATLIKAFAKLRQAKPCRLMILGKGKQREKLLQMAKTLGVEEEVALPGFVDQPMSYMAHASVLGFTSLWEGLGFVLIEALAAGTPVVATQCPSGPREILQNGRFGELVPMQDPDRLCEALMRTLDNPVEKETLRQAAEPYTVSAATDAYLDAFQLPRRRVA